MLAPLAWLYCTAAVLRRMAYTSGLLNAHRFDVPVVIVGNITLGGTGKTPLVAWLGRYLRDAGLAPAIACRGHGGIANTWPQQVRADSDPVVVGDESVLLARLSGCPVAAGPDRVATVRALVEHSGCDMVICDDGLQHLRLGRDVEIAVIDGVRRHGNGRCLPAGPLREPVSRLASVDVVVTNEGAKRGEFDYRLVPTAFRAVADPRMERDLAHFEGGAAHAVCGIGHPERFYTFIRRCGVRAIPHTFSDHHRFRSEEIRFGDGIPVLMTEKDAVKCRRFAGPEHWYLAVQAEPHRLFGARVLTLLESLPGGQEAA